MTMHHYENPPPSASAAAFSWCCVASINDDSKVSVSVVTELAVPDHNGQYQGGPFRQKKKNIDGVSDDAEKESWLDITNSSGWMEYIERDEHRTSHPAGAGAYDTFRCDLLLCASNSLSSTSSTTTTTKPTTTTTSYTQNGRWRIWGEEFHLHRLAESVRSIGKVHNPSDNESHTRYAYSEESIVTATQASKSIVQALLTQAEKSHLLNSIGTYPTGSNLIQLIRLTLLWSPALLPDGQGITAGADKNGSNDNANLIVVRGHACCTGKVIDMDGPVEPIVVSVAAKRLNGAAPIRIDTTMPSRSRDPQYKIASWTRLRQEMERPDTFKPPGVSEVLMLAPYGKWGRKNQVLEGLSSNVFVIYTDGTLRTAQDGVLFGYARHLVLTCAEACCGLIYHPTKPILLEDAKEHLWEEAFITSSSRIIYPIAKVRIYSEDDRNLTDYWEDPVLNGAKVMSNGRKPKWQQLREEILRSGDC